MSAVLIYSDISEPCRAILRFIQDNPVLGPIVQLYDIRDQGPPQDVRLSSVPALITSDRQVIEGRAAVQHWLSTFTYKPVTSYNILKKSSGYAPISRVGRNYEPAMTAELERRINMSVEEGLKARGAP